jgi:hypothetical protein
LSRRQSQLEKGRVGTILPTESAFNDGLQESLDLTYLDGNVDICEVLQDPVDDSLDIVFAEILGNSLDFQEITVLVRDQSVLREVPGKDFGDSNAQLLFLLGKVTSCNAKNITSTQ